MNVPKELDRDIRAKAVELWLALQQLNEGDMLSERTEGELRDVGAFIHYLYGDLP